MALACIGCFVLHYPSNMNFSDIKTIVIVGAGTMGAGIAQLCAVAGYRTILFDINADALPKAQQHIAHNLSEAVKRNKMTADAQQAALQRIVTTHHIAELVGDIVIEAVVEKLAIKVDIFQQIARLNPPTTILASNTSSIPITQIAAAIPQPERVVGMHFFNPAHLMKLVEVIAGAATAPEVCQIITELAQKMGKTTVQAADSPGFIVNRVARPYYVESLQILEEQVADHATIDELLEATGFKMGAFRLMDLIGVDVNFSVTSSLFESFQYVPRFRPSRIQQQKVLAGFCGRKSGKGFYEYE
ncbi:MAG TPA: 3-hydroxyacyl-CoA dehydrogenase NAD-binding domain-containing protein [Chitinophagales bacterium]|nr:3-hydroxyacyl-CoA dehydrogenase NAD-binding domain-containing protein [Chitinophagales bacterium]